MEFNFSGLKPVQHIDELPVRFVLQIRALILRALEDKICFIYNKNDIPWHYIWLIHNEVQSIVSFCEFTFVNSFLI